MGLRDNGKYPKKNLGMRLLCALGINHRPGNEVVPNTANAGIQWACGHYAFSCPNAGKPEAYPCPHCDPSGSEAGPDDDACPKCGKYHHDGGRCQ